MTDSRQKILVIEDNQAVCQVLREKLTEEGFDVKIATNGEDGLNELKKSLPDLVMLDIIMPKLDGAQMLKLLKDNANVKEVPVLVVTNIPQADAEERVQGFPVAEVLVKADYTLEEIVNRVKGILK